MIGRSALAFVSLAPVTSPSAWPVLHHHRREIIRPRDQLARVLFAEIVITLQHFEPLHKRRQIRGSRGIDDADVIEAHTLRRGHAFHFLAFPEQDRRADFQPHKTRRRPQHARLRPFGENDALWVALEFGEDRVDELHGAGVLWGGFGVSSRE